jgi:hypothetical protein
MNEVVNWFTGLATIGGFMYFLAGFGCAYLVAGVQSKLRNRELKIPWHISGITIGVVAIVITVLQSQVAYTTAEHTATEVQDCQREFNSALNARARITSENDEVSQDQRFIIYSWIHDLLFPPPPFDVMDPQDPRRQQHALELTMQTDNKFKASLDRQDVLQAQRDSHPLPKPTCGR